MKAVHITKSNIEQLKAIRNTKAVWLFIVMVFSSFPVSASDAYDLEQKQSLALEETQSHDLAVSASQNIYSFSSRSGRSSFRNDFSSNDSLLMNRIVNIMKENVVISKTTLGINLVWKW